MNEFMYGAIGLLVPWVASVEYRLGQLLSMKATVEKLDKKADMLVEHLINDRETPGRPS